MGQKHKHHDVIVAWAAGAEIEYRGDLTPNWSPIDQPMFMKNMEYRIKPEPPAKVYPVTGMGERDFAEALDISHEPNVAACTKIANAALRHAIDNGQVVASPTEYVKRMERAERTLLSAGYTDNGGELWKPPLGRSPDQRAARDMALAKAVENAVMDEYLCQGGIPKYSLAAIIASVKE